MSSPRRDKVTNPKGCRVTVPSSLARIVPRPRPAWGALVEPEVVVLMEGLTWAGMTYVRLQMTQDEQESLSLVHRPKPRPTRRFRSSADNNLAVMSLWLWLSCWRELKGPEPISWFSSQRAFPLTNAHRASRGSLLSVWQNDAFCITNKTWTMAPNRRQCPDLEIQGNEQRPKTGRGPGQGSPQ